MKEGFNNVWFSTIQLQFQNTSQNSDKNSYLTGFTVLDLLFSINCSMRQDSIVIVKVGDKLMTVIELWDRNSIIEC